MKRLLPALLNGLLVLSASADVMLHRKVVGTHVYEGIEVELAVEPVGHDQSLDLRAGQTVRFLFSIRDVTTGKPISGLFPAAWAQVRPKGITKPPDFQKMVQTFIGGGLFAKPDLDLNVYHVLTLNENNSISVVDPLFGFGGSKLLTMIPLPEPGRDWARMTRASKLFVSLPETNQIALIDTSSWSLSTLMPQVNHPTRLVLQPDEHFLWASLPDGVAVFKTAPFSFQYLFPTGKGEHHITFSPDNRHAYITSSAEATLTVVDLSDFKIARTLPIDPDPTSIAFDPRAEAVYVTHGKAGTISCIDAIEHRVYKVVSSEPGLSKIRFSPEGRWGFVLNSLNNQLAIFDSSMDRIVQSGTVEKEPWEVSFSDNFAYIRHRQSPTVLLVPLDGESLGKESARIPTVEVPAGDSSYGSTLIPDQANTIVQAPGASAVLIANPADKAIYFYKEGMAAPMGQFNNYGQKPRAVAVVDRSLREKSRPGVYETVGKLDKGGLTDLVFFTDSPRMSLGFELDVKEALRDQSSQHEINVTPIKSNQRHVSGQPVGLRFRLDSPLELSKAEIHAHSFMTSGGWQNFQKIETSEDGIASVNFIPPAPGFYQVILSSKLPALKLVQPDRYLLKVESKN